MPEKTVSQITNEYIESTQAHWNNYVNGLRELWDKMRKDINLPSHGVDVYSAKAETFWMAFKATTENEFIKYKEALQSL